MRGFLDVLQKAPAALAKALALGFAEQFGVAGNMAQGRAQVMGHAVGKRFELLVRAAQLAGQLRQLLGLAQDNAEHCRAQFLHAFDDQRVPGFAVAAQFFLPAFETVPWVEVALRPYLFVRLPGPVHRAHLLGAEPEQVVRVDLRNGYCQDTASMGRELGQLVDVAAQVVAVEHTFFATLR
ncbi:hypothetical protein D3C76_859360 [compost metagenome]